MVNHTDDTYSLLLCTCTKKSGEVSLSSQLDASDSQFETSRCVTNALVP